MKVDFTWFYFFNTATIKFEMSYVACICVSLYIFIKQYNSGATFSFILYK